MTENPPRGYPTGRVTFLISACQHGGGGTGRLGRVVGIGVGPDLITELLRDGCAAHQDLDLIPDALCLGQRHYLLHLHHAGGQQRGAGDDDHIGRLNSSPDDDDL